MKCFVASLGTFAIVCIAHTLCANEPAATPDYARDVAPLLRKYCAGCHNAEEQSGELRLDEYAELLQGGEHGPALLAGDAKLSRMMRLMTGEADPQMPPEDEKQPTAEEVALIGRWIDAGAKGPEGGPDPTILITPKLPASTANKPITAATFSVDGRMFAIARYGEVELRSPDGSELLRTLKGHPGKVNDLAFTSDGKLLYAATGVAGLAGEVWIWSVADGAFAGKLQAHRDVIQAIAISRNDETLTTGSYDKQVILWNRETGKPTHTLTQHNGAIYDLAFSPDGKLLASASADETVKVWSVATGERLDTLGQPEGEQYAVMFSPDGERIIAGGADNRIRVWKVVSREKPAINPLLIARFAHEGAVLALGWVPGAKDDLLYSLADDRTMKAWDTKELLARFVASEKQPDTPSAIAVSPEGTFIVTRLDGSLDFFLPPTLGGGPAVVQAASPIAPVDATAPMNKAAEVEPNNLPKEATAITLPATVTGVIHSDQQNETDADLYRFAAKRGQSWILETNAARMKSPLDTHIEVLDAEGNRIERLKLQAVRDSYFTFRGKDSFQNGDFRLHNGEEMKLNQLLYAKGEVVKLYMYPRGPDSGFNVYSNFGKRHTWFDTTSVTHELGEPCYIVQPVGQEATIIPNGLPVFPIYYENDDESQRLLGTDSKLTFTAPADSEYLVRVKDRRGFQGADYKYELTIRPPQLDFDVKHDGANLTVNRGSGKMFKVDASRNDGFDGEIRIDIEGVPQGYYVTTPVVIQAGQWNARGAIYAFADAQEQPRDAWGNVKITATATINGKDVVKQIGNFNEVKLADAPKLLASLSPPGQEPAPQGEIPELEIQRGQTITATLRVTRNDYKGEVFFGGDDSGRNFPHGVYVDNIGLNGVLLLVDQNQREVFITADDWVPRTSRLIFLRTNEEGGQCTWPVRLIVK